MLQWTDKKKKKTFLPHWWKISFALMQTLEKLDETVVPLLAGGGCSPCLFGGGPDWKEFEKAPQIDSKIGIVDNLRIWSHTTKLFKCLRTHGEKTCEMKFSWLSSPKPTRTQRFQIQSQNSTFKKPTTKPTKTNHKTRKNQPQNPRFVPKKNDPPFLLNPLAWHLAVAQPRLLKSYAMSTS